MKPLTTIRSRTVVLPFENIDTDRIVPARFLTTTERAGLGRVLFHDWRYREDGSENPDFALNKPEAKGAGILVAGRNFGCGSSREHAVWALVDGGFRAVIAPGFGDIFHGNAIRNGLLPVVLDEAIVDDLLARLRAAPGTALTVDLVDCCVTTADGARHDFMVDAFARTCLLEGLDEIGYTLGLVGTIEAWERAHPGIEESGT